MPLAFAGASTDKVDCGSAAVLDDLAAATLLMWIYPTDVSNSFRNWCGKGSRLSFFRRGVDGTRYSIVYLRATTNQAVDITTGNITANAWNFIGFTFGSSVTPAAYHGSLAVAASDKSFGVAAGAGAHTTDAADPFTIGNNPSDANSAVPGSIAWVGLWNRALTLGEILDQQFRPRVTSGSIGYWWLGHAGIGTQPDWSGNGNAGTITGATQSSLGLPLGSPFGYDLDWQGAYTAASASAAGTSSGTTTATAVGASSASAAGSSSGTTTVTAVGASSSTAVASASGTSTVVAVGASAAAAVGAAAGTSTVSAAGISSAVAPGTASGTVTATAVGASAAAAAGSQACISTVSGTGAASAAASASAAGTSSVSAIGRALAAALGTVAGTCNVIGVAPSTGSAANASWYYRTFLMGV